MKKKVELFCYLKDKIRYRNLDNKLFWFRKHGRFDWLKGQNFGDYLSLVITEKMVRNHSIKMRYSWKNEGRRLLALGSILHFAKDGDVVWGSGVNGKIPAERHAFKKLDVRMVRGPLTKEFLERKGIRVGNRFGDPALLLPKLFPGFVKRPQKHKIIMIPNYNDLSQLNKRKSNGIKLVSPLNYWKNVVNEILTSELVLSSSLHGVIISEAFEVPVRFVMPVGGETLFKYQDYYEGTGRILNRKPQSFLDNITPDIGMDMSSPVFQCNSLLDAFPVDFFENWRK